MYVVIVKKNLLKQLTTRRTAALRTCKKKKRNDGSAYCGDRQISMRIYGIVTITNKHEDLNATHSHHLLCEVQLQ
ncbi:CLUMA_CG021515, isoform A [Clunio marinus]|uniref:CLUMA_CG021515, isoform A n=1 Tax=Clunio marinus TaxID=568069 RepID=A0A1J1J8F8_9DIPT|nr:CLUMA_CG021515, isoform A [Clunio marinus]